MIKPAERGYLDLQPRVERAAVDIFRKEGPKAVEVFLNSYASDCTKQVGSAYSELVDYLMLQVLVGDREFAHPGPPRVSLTTVPDGASFEKRP